MDDLISRQESIDAIDKYIGTFDAIDRNYLDGLKTAKKLMMQLPFAQQWIPVSSGKLPEKNTHVLVTDWGFVQEAYRSDDRRWYDLDGNKLKGVTAYMPLPKPWEGGDSDGT